MSYGFNNDKSKFPLGSASDLPDPSKTPLEIIGDLQKQIIDNASIENGATASKAYASGDYVCFQGALCKASKAISQGDTLSIGDSENDNLTLTDAAAEFARINSNLSDLTTDTTYIYTQTMAASDYNNLYNNARFTKVGKLVMLEIHGFKTLAARYDNTIFIAGSIDSKYRPSEDVVFTRTDAIGNVYRIKIQPDGAMTCYLYGNDTSGQDNFIDFMTYIKN